eukprot:Tamp_05782.p1 GENE.Tamp_05782~~Tamp_05782.p1  ORF type:complete len:546 (+),score=91.61 Tamp_05782:62-1699(+)
MTMQCMDLKQLTPADAPAPATAAPPEGMFVGGKNATTDEDNLFDCVKKTKGAKKAEAAPKPAADAPAPVTAAPPEGMFVGGKNATADEDNPRGGAASAEDRHRMMMEEVERQRAAFAAFPNQQKADDAARKAAGMDPPHQDWNVSSQSAMPTSNYHHSTQPCAGYEPFQSAGVASAGYAASYETTGFGSDTAAYEDAGSAAGSRLFERWAGQGLGGGPASSRLTSFVGDGAQAMSNAMSSGGAGANGAFAGALSYNGFQGDDGSAGNEQHQAARAMSSTRDFGENKAATADLKMLLKMLLCVRQQRKPEEPTWQQDELMGKGAVDIHYDLTTEAGLKHITGILETEFGFDLSKSFADLDLDIKEKLKPQIGSVDETTNNQVEINARQGCMTRYMEVLKAVPKTYYMHTNTGQQCDTSYVYNVPGHPIFKTMLKAQQARNMFHNHTEKLEPTQCIPYKHVHNCVRLLLYTYKYYHDIPLCVPDAIKKRKDLKIPKPTNAYKHSDDDMHHFINFEHLKQQSERSCECVCKRPCEWYKRMQRQNQNRG